MNNKIQAILDQLNKLTPEEEQLVQKWISDQQALRVEQRKNELWGNVRAAIAKYESEIELITFYCRHCGDDCTIDEIDSDEPGFVTIS